MRGSEVDFNRAQMRCLVTGANGFVGRALLRHLQAQGYGVAGAVRRADHGLLGRIHVLEDRGADTDWHRPLQECDVVIHTAGRAHVLAERSADPLALFREANVAGTLNLARQAMDAGVKRFVFVSSIGVNGSRTLGAPFTERSVPAPDADYARSKREAEEQLQALVHGSEMEWVIVRPPLVYGAQAPGNFARLLRLARAGMPVPFKGLDNRRSLIALENLVDFLSVCAFHPKAANQLFVVADGGAVSTESLWTLLAEGMGRRPHMFRLPRPLLRMGANLMGQGRLYEQLFGSLEVDVGKARSLLGWSAPRGTADALRQAACDYGRLGR